MTLRDDDRLIRDMVDHAREAVELLGDRSLEQLVADRVLTLALTRLVEIIGEAASRVSADRQGQITDIPWHAVIGMRNRLVHAYSEVDTRILWLTLTDELGPLIQALQRHINEH